MTAASHALSESAMNRLISPNRGDERRAQAYRLGSAVMRHISLANRDERMHFPGSEIGRDRISSGDEYKISTHVGAWLKFVADKRHEDLEGTPEWLPHTERVNLVLQIYDDALPDIMSDAPDPVQEVPISLTPTNEYGSETGEPGSQPFAAYDEDDNRLDPQDTETVIGILNFMAGEIKRATQNP